MFKFLRALIGGLGIISYKIPFFAEDYFPEIVKQIKSYLKPGDIIFSRKKKAGFLDGGIQAATDFPWPHVFLYVGGEYARYARKTWPQFFEPKELIFSKSQTEFNTFVPPEASEQEIIDAQQIITTRDIDEYFQKQEQLAVWRRALTKEETEEIIKTAYETLGTMYDVLEIGKHLFSFFPNSKKQYVCSTDVVKAYEKIEKIVNASNPDITMQSPRDIWEYLQKQNNWKLAVKIGWR